jgi:type IV conjugative transfer system protein TraE
MQLNVMKQNIELVARQRNVFLVLCALSLVSLILVSLKLLSISERTILVPGLHQEAWTSDKKVSSSYLEENTAMYLPLLVDLDTTSIAWKRDRVLAHVATTDPDALKLLSEYFANAKEQYEHFALSTHFALKKLETDAAALTVRAYGQLISRFGNRGFESEPVIYSLSYEWVAGRLLIKEFVKLSKEDVENE